MCIPVCQTLVIKIGSSSNGGISWSVPVALVGLLCVLLPKVQVQVAEQATATVAAVCWSFVSLQKLKLGTIPERVKHKNQLIKHS